MKKLFLLLLALCIVQGCSQVVPPLDTNTDEQTTSSVIPTRKDDSTSCAYWKCSTEKKVYMQKYVKGDDGKYRPAGTYKLEGTGAFPLDDLDKHKSDGTTVSWSVGFDPCPYCSNTTVGQCHCKKVFCVSAKKNAGTCPWCGSYCTFTPGDAMVGGGG